jgi:hypothetical protein
MTEVDPVLTIVTVGFRVANCRAAVPSGIARDQSAMTQIDPQPPVARVRFQAGQQQSSLTF